MTIDTQVKKIIGPEGERPIDDFETAERDVFQSLYLQTLNTTSALDGLSGKDVEELAKYGNLRLAREEEKIIGMNEPADALYIILEGQVNVRVNGDDPIDQLGTGRYFGEASLSEGMKRTANVYATQDTVLFEIKRGEFERFEKDHPVPSKRIYKAVLRDVFSKLAETTQGTSTKIAALREGDEAYDRNVNELGEQVDTLEVENARLKAKAEEDQGVIAAYHNMTSAVQGGLSVLSIGLDRAQTPNDLLRAVAGTEAIIDRIYKKLDQQTREIRGYD